MTLRNAPLSGWDSKSYSLICISEKQKYFCKRGWTRHNCKAEVICPSGSEKDVVLKDATGDQVIIIASIRLDRYDHGVGHNLRRLGA